ncbi:MULTISPECIES: putative quinol monooxygenase [unclassified Streptomyces]|uniref:putative quinol monooxygenase n=1 Tax=unclassified Streptomyces TaxID=2593676 RepID=UPI0003811F10|nr:MULTISPECIES: antibiotic biosynthesis monooxygenase family protein [unclassified Streptomyces]EYT79544.1 antibiotic biosynthesis monooxygenase [Streptomyces sp. Tu 6176]
MSFTVIARYRCLPGRQDTVLGLLDRMAAASRAEPGCLGYRVHQGTEDPRAIALYEEYATEADFTAHCAAAHFQDIVLAQVVPLLESRDVLRCAPRPEVSA